MALKRIPSDDEIDALVARFRALWSPGDVIRPWLRQHAEMLLELVQSGWSWAAIARAMTQAGITYRTGKPWTADWLQSDAYRARLPLKGYRRKDQARQALARRQELRRRRQYRRKIPGQITQPRWRSRNFSRLYSSTGMPNGQRFLSVHFSLRSPSVITPYSLRN